MGIHPGLPLLPWPWVVGGVPDVPNQNQGPKPSHPVLGWSPLLGQCGTSTLRLEVTLEG